MKNPKKLKPPLSGKLAWILIPGVILFIAVGVYQEEQRKKVLAKEGELTLAVITKKKYGKRGDVDYYYYFRVQGKDFKNLVRYPYQANDLGYLVGDSIYVLYMADDPGFNYDFRYLKEDGGYGLDELKYQKLIKETEFSEKPHRVVDNQRIRIKLW